jgi:plastocyanin domain-containing protein
VTRRRLLGALAALAAAGAAAAVAQALRAPPAALARARTGRAAPGPDGVQTAALVVERGEYRPNVVHARAGAPLRLRVAVHDRSACATRLLVPDLGIDLTLAAGGDAVAVLPAARPGSYVFTCAERMVKGVLVLE